jgi:hypothetical protein
MTRTGWHRCDAEHVDVVRQALARAHDPVVAKAWADRAGLVLERAPVLAGAVQQLAALEGAAVAAWQLMLAASGDSERHALARFTSAALDRHKLDQLAEERFRAIEEGEGFGFDELAG